MSADNIGNTWALIGRSVLWWILHVLFSAKSYPSTSGKGKNPTTSRSQASKTVKRKIPEVPDHPKKQSRNNPWILSSCYFTVNIIFYWFYFVFFSTLVSIYYFFVHCAIKWIHILKMLSVMSKFLWSWVHMCRQKCYWSILLYRDVIYIYIYMSHKSSRLHS